MSDEQLDYFDENYVRQGTAAKSYTRKNGLWVHSFHCWIINDSADPGLLFQKRASTKQLFPDYLDISAAGHLAAGEVVKDGVREISEEVGLDVSFDDLIPLGIKMDVAKTNGIINRQFANVFLLPIKGGIESMKLDKSELDGMVEIRISDGLKLFSSEVSSVSAKGVEKDGDGKWRPISKMVGVDDFIPRVDPYYYKIFIISDLFKNGYKHLSI